MGIGGIDPNQSRKAHEAEITDAQKAAQKSSDMVVAKGTHTIHTHVQKIHQTLLGVHAAATMEGASAPVGATPTTATDTSTTTKDSTTSKSAATSQDVPSTALKVAATLTPEQQEALDIANALTSIADLKKEIADLKEKISSLSSSSSDADVSAIKQQISDAYTKMQSIVSKLQPYETSGTAQYQPLIKDIDAAVNQLLAIPQPTDSTSASISKWSSDFNDSTLSTVEASGKSLANEIGVDSDNIWQGINDWIFGSLMNNLEKALSSAQELVAAETAIFNNLGNMLSKLVKWGVTGDPAPWDLSVPNSKNFTAFLHKLSALHRFKTGGGLSNWFNSMEKQIAEMRSKAVGHPSLIQHVNSLWNNLREMKNIVSQVAGMSPSKFVKRITTPKGGHSLKFYSPVIKQYSLSKGVPKVVTTITAGGQHVTKMVTVVPKVTITERFQTPGGSFKTTKVTLKQPAWQFKTPAAKMTLKALFNQFYNVNKNFTNAVKNDHAAIEGLTNTAQANLRMQMMYMQEMYQIGPQLIQTLAELAKTVAQNTKGQ